MSTPLSENARMGQWGQLAIFSPWCHVTRLCYKVSVWMGSRCVQFGVIALTLSYWLLEVQHDTSWQRTLWGSEKMIVALHKDGVGYKKIAKSLKLSCSMGPRPYSGLTGQVPLRAGLAMVYQINWVHMLSIISQGCVWEIDVWVLPALLQRLKGWGSACQCSEHMPHTASNWSAWLLSQKEASSKNDAQESPKTVCWRQAD